MILCVGLTTVDLVYRVDRVPGVDEKAQATDMEIAAGGPAANAAVAAAALGAPVTLLTAIGAHPLGHLVRADLQSHGVHIIDAAADFPAPPPVSAITVLNTTGQRTIVSRNAGDLVIAPPRDIPDAEVTLVDGHHPALALAAAKSARRLLVDAGTWRPVFTDLLPHADVVACSAAFRHPQATYTPTPDPAANDDAAPASTAPGARDAATAVAVGAPHVLVTHGPGPIRWFSGGEAGSIDVPPVDAVDTAGAGDVFHGALAAALAGYGISRPPTRRDHASLTISPDKSDTSDLEPGRRSTIRRAARRRPGTPAQDERADLAEAIRLAIRVAGVRVAHPGPRSWLAAL